MPNFGSENAGELASGSDRGLSGWTVLQSGQNRSPSPSFIHSPPHPGQPVDAAGGVTLGWAAGSASCRPTRRVLSSRPTRSSVCGISLVASNSLRYLPTVLPSTPQRWAILLSL